MSKTLDRTIAGFAAGLPIQLAHPIDLIKTRMQVADPSGNSNVPVITSYRKMAMHIYNTEGLRALYKGVLFSIIPNFLIAGYFVGNPICKKILERKEFFRERPTYKIIASNFIVSGILAVLTTPLYVLKTRKLTDTNTYDKTKSIRALSKEVKQTMGRRGFLRGVTMTFVMGINGGITTGIIDLIKSNYDFKNFESLGLFLVGGSARVFTSLFFYPASTIRARVEQNQIFSDLKDYKYSGVIDCIRKTYRAEGLGGFYKGFLANATRAFITTGSVMFAYTAVFNRLQQRGAATNQSLR